MCTWNRIGLVAGSAGRLLATHSQQVNANVRRFVVSLSSWLLRWPRDAIVFTYDMVTNDDVPVDVT